jgi:membrane-associated phospholipid phosphatase
MRHTSTSVQRQHWVQRVNQLLTVALGAYFLTRLHLFETAGLRELLVLALVPIVAAAAIRRSWREVLMWATFMLAFVAFADLRALADDVGFPVRTQYAIGLDRALFFGAVPAHWLQDRLYSGAAAWFDWAMIAVHLSYFPVPHVLAFGLWIYRPQHLARYLGAIIATCYAALPVHVLLPTVPPWLASERGALEPVARIVQDALVGFSAEAYERGNIMVGGNEVAAMPSLHAALSVLVALAALRLGRVAGWIGWGYALLMASALVYLGEHYVIDILAGALLAVACWHAVGAVRRQPGTRESAGAPDAAPARTVAPHGW